MRYFFMICFILLASCSTKEERAAYKAERDAKKAKISEAYQKSAVKRGSVNLACLKAVTKYIKNKPKQCTKNRAVITGTKNTGTFVYCFPPDMYGNQVCDSKTKTEDIVSVVPYQTTCDANAEVRNDFLEACRCKNGLQYEIKFYAVGLEASPPDLKMSEEYLIKKWRNFGRIHTKRIPAGPSEYEIEQCDAKDDYNRKQSWYKRIPVVN